MVAAPSRLGRAGARVTPARRRVGAVRRLRYHDAGEAIMALKKLGHVVLKVRDLDRSEAFYTDVVGLTVVGRLPGRMVFFTVTGNEDSHDFAVWKVGPDAASPAPRQVGLFHVAWQVERPEDLEAFHASLVARGVPVQATMDHGANQSIY